MNGLEMDLCISTEEIQEQSGQMQQFEMTFKPKKKSSASFQI